MSKIENIGEGGRLMSVKDYAKYKGISVPAVYVWIKKGKVDCRTFGGMKLIYVENVKDAV